MARIVLTHGRGLPARDETRLHRKFARYLREGLEAVGYDGLDDHDLAFIYYGNLLEPPLEEPAPKPDPSPLFAAGQALAGTVRRFPFDEVVDGLRGTLRRAGMSDARICALIGEHATCPPIEGQDADASVREWAVEAALEARTEELLDDPQQLRSVLEQQFSPALDDDDAITRSVGELQERLGDDARGAAARRVAEEGGGDGPEGIDATLRDWIVGPATDAIAGLRALSRVWQEYGVDLRQYLSDWQRAVISEVLTRWERTDLGRHWATVFDVVAVIANNSILDGIFIARQMQDVESYFRNADIRNSVRGLFRDVLRDHDEPTILIAHSLGSVIAYDVLREYPDLDVSGLVTLGSPLSMDWFRDRLARPGESGDKLPVPRMLAEWVNVYSEMDPLALGSGVSRYFRGGGEGGRGPIDLTAENTGYLDAHNPDQYLRSSVTANVIIGMIAHAMVRTAE